MSLHPCNGPMLQRLPARTAIVGDALPVRRALPNRERRMVGAWCFLDHAGPLDYTVGGGLSVGPHPHIGLQTFTWMIDGDVLHKDSLGSEQWVRPGQVNLMTAGRGISHTEESPVDRGGRVQAAQLWIALPEAERHRAPSFAHHPELPRITHAGIDYTVLVGEAFGQRAAPVVYSPLVGIDGVANGASVSTLPLRPDFEHAVLCLEGEISVEGERIAPGELLYLGTHREGMQIATEAPARFIVVGGEPFPEDVLLWWNFVARTQAEMVEAVRDWNARDARFGQVDSTLPALIAPDPTGLGLKTRA